VPRSTTYSTGSAGSFVLPPCPAPDQPIFPYQFDISTLTPLHQIPLHCTCTFLLRPARRSKPDRAKAETLHQQTPRILFLVTCMIASLTEAQPNSCRREAVMVSAPIIMCSGYKRPQAWMPGNALLRIEDFQGSLSLTPRDLTIKCRLRYMIVDTTTEVKDAAW
jgi:hypothetical protein